MKMQKPFSVIIFLLCFSLFVLSTCRSTWRTSLGFWCRLRHNCQRPHYQQRGDSEDLFYLLYDVTCHAGSVVV